MRRAAFIDIDGTLVRCLSQQVLAKKLAEEKFYTSAQKCQMTFWFLLYKMGLIKSSIKIRENIYASFRSRPKLDVDAIIARTAREIVGFRIFWKMRSVIALHQRNNDFVFAISGSLTDLIRPICDEFKIINVFATRLLFEKDRYTGTWDGDIWEGESKAKLIKSLSEKHEISLEESFAYADSFTDLPMLEIVGHPVVVNPDKRLSKIAMLRRWEIIVGSGND